MRGRPVNQGLQHPAVRNTPAYAGKTKDSVLVLNQCLKHPRVCGEDPKIKAKRIHAPETPPRMRGRPQGGSCHSAPVGNTPAYAGKTLMIICLYAADWKHPRVCGEDGAALPAAVFTEETPPRMRGRPSVSSNFFSFLRNTPAYAGKTIPLAPRRHGGEKHPRVCGEDVAILAKGNWLEETPPRMRGRHAVTLRNGKKGGNTPAYAGKTMTPAQ